MTEGDPQTEEALLAFILAAAELAARLEGQRQTAPTGKRIALDRLGARLHQARAAAEQAFSIELFD